MRKEILRKGVVCVLTISMLCMGMCMPMRVNAATLQVGPTVLERNSAKYHLGYKVLKERKGDATFQMRTVIASWDYVSVNATTPSGKNISNGITFNHTSAGSTKKSSYLSGYNSKDAYYCSKEILLIESQSTQKTITMDFTP